MIKTDDEVSQKFNTDGRMLRPQKGKQFLATTWETYVKRNWNLSVEMCSINDKLKKFLRHQWFEISKGTFVLWIFFILWLGECTFLFKRSALFKVWIAFSKCFFIFSKIVWKSFKIVYIFFWCYLLYEDTWKDIFVWAYFVKYCNLLF